MFELCFEPGQYMLIALIVDLALQLFPVVSQLLGLFYTIKMTVVNVLDDGFARFQTIIREILAIFA